MYQFTHYEELHWRIFCSGHSALVQLNIDSLLPCSIQKRLNVNDTSFANVCPDISLGCAGYIPSTIISFLHYPYTLFYLHL